MTGQPVWQKTIADYERRLRDDAGAARVKDKVIIGVAGGEYGIRGFIAAHDAVTGDEEWRFYTIPGAGRAGLRDLGRRRRRVAARRRVGVAHGLVRPTLDLTYWGIGNPGPTGIPTQRPGDNLYSDSVVALDPDTGELKWHFQFTPNDDYDYDAVQIPVLVDVPATAASSGKLMYWANRNGFFYVLDRTTGEFIRGKPFVNVNWASGLDESGRPIETPQPLGSVTFPGVQGGTNWYSPSYSPRTGLVLFVGVGKLRLGVSARRSGVSAGAHVRRRNPREPARGRATTSPAFAAARSTTGPKRSATAPSSRSTRARASNAGGFRRRTFRAAAF